MEHQLKYVAQFLLYVDEPHTYYMLSYDIFMLIITEDDDHDDIVVQDGGYRSGQNDYIVHAPAQFFPDDVTFPEDPTPHVASLATTREEITDISYTTDLHIFANVSASLSNTTDILHMVNVTSYVCADDSCSSLAVSSHKVDPIIYNLVMCYCVLLLIIYHMC